MARPRKIKQESQKVVETPLTGLEIEIRKIVSEILREEEYKLSKEDIKEIITELIPNLDLIISKAIKKHIKILVSFVDSKIKE